MPYAIMRFEKRKGGTASALEKHHERTKEHYGSNPDIDRARSAQNYHLIEPRLKYYGEIQTRIERAQKKNPKCKVRKDSVKFIDTIVTATPQFLEEMSEERVRHYFEHALEFFKKEVGEENIFTAVVHMDERNPHMHLCFVPLTEDKRLSAKEVIGGREKLVEWQDKFHDHMAAAFPMLERGQAAAVTKRKHIPTWLYKQSHRLTDEMVQIQNELDNITPVNAKKQREKIIKLLQKWYPKVNAFEAKLKPYDKQLAELRQNEQLLRNETAFAKNETARAKWDAQQEHAENLNLIYELRECQDFIDSIPEELLEELKQRHQEQQQAQEQKI